MLDLQVKRRGLQRVYVRVSACARDSQRFVQIRGITFFGSWQSCSPLRNTMYAALDAAKRAL